MALILLFPLSEIEEKKIYGTKVLHTELIVIRNNEAVSILYGRCLHRKALLKDGFVRGNDVICGVHNWDYNMLTGVSDYNPEEKLHKFHEIIQDENIYIDEDEIREWERENPQNFRDNTMSYYSDNAETEEEPYVKLIQSLSKKDTSQEGGHGESVSMGVRDKNLPKWEDIQILTAQLATPPLLDEDTVSTETIIGKNAKKPLILKTPLFVSDMSFGSLSKEAKIALARGAEMAGTGICSGEGGALPEEQAENSHYFYEFASGKFGFSWEKVVKSQAFHFKFGQGAKTGTGGHLPGNKVTEEIAQVRGLNVGEPAISPATFVGWGISDYQKFAEEVREKTGGIPIGVKLSAQHIEKDIDAALKIGVDYIILDGRGGGTGSAPRIFRDNISVPTIPALARARKHLQKLGREDISLIITGGLRIPDDFIKALALGADAVGLSNSVLQALGCVGMRACGSNNCPVGIATQKESLRARIIIQEASIRVRNFLNSSTHLMGVMAKACGHDSLCGFNPEDISTMDHNMHLLTGITYAGVSGR